MMKLAFLISTLIIIHSNQSFAYMSTLDTGEIVPSGHYRMVGELQWLTDPSGFNVNAGMDAGVNDSSTIRVVAGIGAVNFYTGLFYKWIPFPDTEKQPAVGIIGGGTWARYGGDNYPGFRITPITSKKFDTDYGFLTPYAALPFGVISGPRRNAFPLQLTVGTDWKPVDVEGFSFLAELSLGLNESPSVISAGVIYLFPE